MSAVMYSPLSPILAADAASDIDVHGLLQRLEALGAVLLTIRRLAGPSDLPTFNALSARAELAAGLASLPTGELGPVARRIDTLSAILHAGLLALERNRSKGRLNHAAAGLLHEEGARDYRHILHAAGVAERRRP